MALPDEGVVVCPFCGQWIEIRHVEDGGSGLPAIPGYSVRRPVYAHEPPFCQKFEDIDADALTALLTAGTMS
jgi:hypothetical protein